MKLLKSLFSQMPRTKKFWHSVAAQSTAGLILLGAATLTAGFTGLITDTRAIATFAMGLLGVVMLVLFGGMALMWSEYRQWVKSTAEGRKAVLAGLIRTVGLAGPVVVAAGLFVVFMNQMQTMTADNEAHPKKTLIAYISKVRENSSHDPRAGNCFQSVLFLSNQTAESILFLGASGSSSVDAGGNGFIDAQDLTWVPVGVPGAKAVTGPLELAPAHAAIVRLTSTKANMLDNLNIVPASPLVELRQGGGMWMLTPSMVRSVDALGPISCHDPLPIDPGNLPDDRDLYRLMYPTPSAEPTGASK